MPSPEEIEEKIKEQRTVEANKKGLVGQNGKIAVVLKVFGDPIIAQSEGGFYVDTNYLKYEEEDVEPRNNKELLKKIPIMDIANNERPTGNEWEELTDPLSFAVQKIGLHFDGLSRSMHMEIKYDDLNSELSLSYKGYCVYKEIKGEIVSYVPNPEWEKWIDSLYKKAKEKQRVTKEIEFENQIKQAEKNKNAWWQKIVSRWGVE